MKLSRAVWLFWIGNSLLLAAAAAFLWTTGADTQAERETRERAVAELPTREPRIEWKPDAERQVFDVIDTMLSPTERPKPPEVKVEVKVEPPKPKTDAELRAQLEKDLNRRFKLQRLILSSSDECPHIAMLQGGGLSLQWMEGMDLQADYGKSRSAALRKLACELKVLSIDEAGVLVDAASFEKPDKRFEVRLTIKAEPVSFSFNRQWIPDTKPALPLDEEDEPAAPKRPHDPEREEEFSEQDHSDEAIQDFAKYTRSTEHGLEILPELPHDSPARKYGARGGEIIKTINGESVKAMSDVRRTVRTQYNAGTREFRVGYERDGLPHEKTFTVK